MWIVEAKGQCLFPPRSKKTFGTTILIKVTKESICIEPDFGSEVTFKCYTLYFITLILRMSLNSEIQAA